MTGTEPPTPTATPTATPARHDRLQNLASQLPDKEFWFRMRRTLEQTADALSTFTAVCQQAVDTELARLAQARTAWQERSADAKLLLEVEYRQWLAGEEEQAR